MSRAAEVGDLLKQLAPTVLANLVRRHGDFDACEDAVQEALLVAAERWPEDGVPENPTGWLITVASRRWIELWRRDVARRRREATAAAAMPQQEPGPAVDDTLTLLMLCCHPSLSPTSQVALTLRAVGGLTTAEIARAFLVPEATMAQRISRAKQRIRESGGEFRSPPQERSDRIQAVLHVLYLIFNEGYTASSGRVLQRVELSAEAIRLARQLRELLPQDGEIAGLLALMLLTDARRPARTRPEGSLVPLAEQDRTLWNSEAIAEGARLVEWALTTTPIGPFQLQAAIAATHDEAIRAEDTDWHEILGLYELLEGIDPSPMVKLNRIVALAMVRGPEEGLRTLTEAAADPALADHYRTDAVRAHLLERVGDTAGAAASYRRAARRTLSIPERSYLQSRAARLA